MLHIAICLITFLSVSGPSEHPFHISVTEIKDNRDQKALQMTVRLFLDDLEQGLREHSQNNELDIYQKEDSVYLNGVLEKYVLANLSISTKKALELNYLGFEYDQDVLWCYVEATKVRPFTELTIRNTLLVSTFDDQENLVHVRKNGKVKSLRMSKSKDRQQLNWEKPK